MTSGAGWALEKEIYVLYMLLVLASGLPDLNIGIRGPQGRWAEHHHIRTKVYFSCHWEKG